MTPTIEGDTAPCPGCGGVVVIDLAEPECERFEGECQDCGNRITYDHEPND